MDEVNAEGQRVSSARSGRLLNLSLQYLADARSPAISRAGAVGAAFDAGYLALLSVLPDARARACRDHPNADLLHEACRLAAITDEDCRTARQLVEAYYEGGHARFEPSECLAWAERVRSAVLQA